MSVILMRLSGAFLLNCELFALTLLFALGFQGFLILVCVAIYAVLVQSIPSSGDIHGAIWGTAGYTVLLAFALFKTGSLSKSIFNSH